MANLPEPQRDDEFVFDLYDASAHEDEPLVWLLPDETLALLDSTRQGALQVSLRDIALPGTIENPERVTPGFESPILSPGVPFSHSLNEKLLAQHRSTRGLLRIAAVAAILLLGTTLPSIVERSQPAYVKASAASNSSAAPAEAVEKGRILNVMTSRDESIENLSLRYAGHSDDQQLEEIRKLNPEVLDFEHLQGGEVIKIPLPALATQLFAHYIGGNRLGLCGPRFVVTDVFFKNSH
jgi:hypothetical protein